MNHLAILDALGTAFRKVGPARWEDHRPYSTRDDPQIDSLGRWVVCFYSSGIPVELFPDGEFPTLAQLRAEVTEALLDSKGVQILAISLTSYPARPGLQESIGFRVYLDGVSEW